MSLQFSNRKLTLMRSQSSRDSDPIDAQLNDDVAGREIIYQDVRNLDISVEAHNDAPDRESWSASGHKAPYVKHKASVEGEVPLTAGVDGSSGTSGNPSADDAPWYAPILKALNLEEDASGSNTAIYTPSTTLVAPATFHQYIRNVEDNKSRLRVATDFVGSGELSISAGEEAMMSFSGGAFYSAITTPRNYVDSNGKIITRKDGTTVDDSTNPITYKLADENPLIPKNMTVTVGGNTYEISEFTLDLNWTQDTIDVVNATPGKIDHVNTRGTTDRATGGFTLLRSTEANFDQLITDYEAANEIAINIVLQEVNGTRSIKVDIPKAQLGPESEGENGNLMQHEFEFACNRDTDQSLAGDNDVKITFDNS